MAGGVLGLDPFVHIQMPESSLGDQKPLTGVPAEPSWFIFLGTDAPWYSSGTAWPWPSTGPSGCAPR